MNGIMSYKILYRLKESRIKIVLQQGVYYIGQVIKLPEEGDDMMLFFDKYGKNIYIDIKDIVAIEEVGGWPGTRAADLDHNKD